MPLVPFESKTPTIDASVFVAPNAYLIGDVTVGKNSGVFFSATLRGDLEPIIVGEGSNIQDGAILHTSDGKTPCVVEDHVTIGHGVILHSCRVCKGALVGMGSVVLDEAVIGEGALIGARSLVTSGTCIPAGMLAIGSPAKVVRELKPRERDDLIAIQRRYVGIAQVMVRTL